ncbi:MAG: sigma 54-interacting transcriptional regulator [Gammaproteobacteria bacterium]
MSALPAVPAKPAATLWESALHSTPMALVCIDPVQDRLLDTNPALEILTGFSRTTLLQMAPSQLFPGQRPQLISFTEACQSRQHAFSTEFSLLRDTGDTLPVEITASWFSYAEQPALLLLVSDARHYTLLREQAEWNQYHRGGLLEWRRIEEVFLDIERKNQLILRAAGEGIYGVNPDGVTTFVNPAAEQMLGWSAAELVGRNAHEIFHHSHSDGSCYPRHHCPIYAAFHDGIVHQEDNEVFWRKDGSCFPVEYTSTPIEDQGRLVGAVVIFRDVSERREADRRLREALSQVESLKRKLELENAYLQEEIRAEHNHREIVGRSEAILHIIRQIELVAPTDANVLVTGESGTGKELIARAIHESSQRSKRPLIRVNCAAIPRDLFESEFFGHVKGAFTGASHDRIGRFELADGGTLFLDEVGEIPLELQGKLLRVLQEKQFERVGDTKTRRVDVRVIAATNRDLKQDVAQHKFREDLYFRLNVFPLESAPLRQRIEDIPLLALHFIDRACRKLNKPVLPLSMADLNKLQQYNWPGNIRELENIIERAVILSGNSRLQIDLPTSSEPKARAKSHVITVGDEATTPVLTDQERFQRDRENLIAALRQCNGKVAGKDGAASLLGVRPTTLYSRLQKYRIDAAHYKSTG